MTATLRFTGFEVFSPIGNRLSFDQWSRLESAVVWASDGFHALAKRAAAAVQGELELSAKLAAAMAAGRQDRAAKMALVRPNREPLNTVQLGQLDRAEIDRRTGGKAGIGRAWQKVRVIERQRRNKAEDAALQDSLGETIALQQARGAVIEPDVKRGHMRRQSALESLVASKTLTRIELAAGERYSEMYDAAAVTPHLKVANYSATGGGCSDAVADRCEEILDARKARIALAKVHAFVKARVPSPRAVFVLRRVAGRGQHVSHFSKGAGRIKNTEALKAALTVLAHRWGLN